MAVMSPGSECGRLSVGKLRDKQCNLELCKIQIGNAGLEFTAGDLDRVRESVASGLLLLMVKDTIQQLTEGLSCSFTDFDKSLLPAGVSVVVRPTNEDVKDHQW